MTPRPIVPERFDTGPVRVDDDDNQAMAKLFARNAIAQGFAVEYAGKTYRPLKERPSSTEGMDSGDLADLGLEDEAAKPEPLASFIELDSGEAEHTIAIKPRNGATVHLRPVITFASARKNGWHQKQIQRLTAACDATEDEQEVDKLMAEISRHHHAMLRASIPNLPEGLLDDLSPGQVSGLMAAMERIGQELRDEAERISGKVWGRRSDGK